MKILFCNNNLIGIILFRKNLLEHFIEKGYDVTVVTPCEGEENYIKKLPPGVVYIPIKMNRTSTNPIADLFFFIKLLKILRKEKPDYVFNYTIKPNIFGSIAAKITGIPCSSMIAGLGYTFANNNISSRIARMLYRIGMRCSKNILLLNKDNLEVIKRRNLCDARKLILLQGGEGVSLEHYTFFNNQSKEITFLFIARLIEEKGYNEFVKAAKYVKIEHPHIRFCVIGGFDLGYPKAITQEQVESDVRSGVIENLGVTDNMLSYYRIPGVVVCIPSYYSEGLNRSLMEACAVGKPIITTNHPGCRETVINDKNGYIVPIKNPKALAEAMIKYIRLSDEEKNNMSLESRKLANERFDIKKVIQVYDQIILNK